MIADSIYIILLSSLMGILTNVIAWKKGFYTWAPLPEPRILFKNVLSIFALYVGATFFVIRFLLSLMNNLSEKDLTMTEIVGVQFSVILVMLACMYAYCRYQPGKVFAKIWKNPLQPVPTTVLHDVLIGAVTWLMAFPVVQTIGQILDLILSMIYKMGEYEQVAVRYLKTTLNSPPLMIMALISIVIIAPIVEEFLFRGTLQTYLKRHVGPKRAILLSAVCFAFFHYSPEQGVGNISLIPSLFTFACFLGYIYERQGSLYAPIGLHMTFNLVSSIRILLSPG